MLIDLLIILHICLFSYGLGENNQDMILNEIKKDFDYIVVATGSQIIAKDLNVMNSKFLAKVRIAKVLGNFEPGILKIWLNKTYSKNGYGYLITNN